MIWAALLATAADAAPRSLAARWMPVLAAKPALAAARLADPRGPLAAQWPAVSASLAGAPVWAVRVALDPEAGTIEWNGVLAWTAPHAVDHVTLRFAAPLVGGRVDALTLNGEPIDADSGLIRIDADLAAGQTAAFALRGRVTATADLADKVRLFHTDDAAVYTSWLPLPTPCGADRCDERPWPGVSDPGSFPSTIFLVELTAPRGWQVVHPGEETPGKDIVAIGVRELPLVALRGWQVREATDGPIPLRLWSRTEEPAEEVWSAARFTLADLWGRYGPLSSPALDVLGVMPPASGMAIELPGMVLVPPLHDPKPHFPYGPNGPSYVSVSTVCLIVAHEVAHQWWYGEVGSDALAEPWVDESLAQWSGTEACARAGDPAGTSALAAGVAPCTERVCAPAAELTAHWGAIYHQAVFYFRMLHDTHPAELDAALARWLAEHRWQVGTGDALRATLREAVGAEREREAWCAIMDPGCD